MAKLQEGILSGLDLGKVDANQEDEIVINQNFKFVDKDGNPIGEGRRTSVVIAPKMVQRAVSDLSR
jgi:hypothetical protein